jgi:hypothetical protein
MKRILAVFLCFVSYANGALTFGGATDAVNCGSSTALDNVMQGAGTIMMWIFPTDLSGNVSWQSKCISDDCTLTGSNQTFNSGATLEQMVIPKATSNLTVRATFGAGNALPKLIVNRAAYAVSSNSRYGPGVIRL